MGWNRRFGWFKMGREEIPIKMVVIVIKGKWALNYTIESRFIRLDNLIAWIYDEVGNLVIDMVIRAWKLGFWIKRKKVFNNIIILEHLVNKPQWQ